MIVASAATSVLLLTILVAIFLALQSTRTRRSSERSTGMCPGSTEKLPNIFVRKDINAALAAVGSVGAWRSKGIPRFGGFRFVFP